MSEDRKEELDVKSQSPADSSAAEADSAIQPKEDQDPAKDQTKANQAEEKNEPEQKENPLAEEYVIAPIPEGQKLSFDQRMVWEDRANEIIEKIRPYIQHDGGDVELLGVDEDGIAYVTFLGACAGCMMAGEDFSTGIRLLLLDEFPELKEVVLVG